MPVYPAQYRQATGRANGSDFLVQRPGLFRIEGTEKAVFLSCLGASLNEGIARDRRRFTP